MKKYGDKESKPNFRVKCKIWKLPIKCYDQSSKIWKMLNDTQIKHIWKKLMKTLKILWSKNPINILWLHPKYSFMRHTTAGHVFVVLKFHLKFNLLGISNWDHVDGMWRCNGILFMEWFSCNYPLAESFVDTHFGKN